MPLASKDPCARDQRCPDWCALDHSGTRTALLHESESQGLSLSHRHDVRLPESIDARVVQYEPDDAGDTADAGDAASPSVELSYHVGPRYRVISLSPYEARRLAGILLACADRTEQ
ncbi:hypothetical protein E1264_14515 [Actinomadura sp. KC216]|uniref:DUF6907 domain-containing protein n=1 Tax=Actinomadura sp. KC216 TaxID=2530370 RepID=UPI001053197F|nr:hypothetical protein [Actinomadura sp. KC216]TDB87453.1 hypothetical protein E1264_14515 [Actinomadura sp. KC216]